MIRRLKLSGTWCQWFGHRWRHFTKRTLMCRRQCGAHYFLDLDRLYEPRR